MSVENRRALAQAIAAGVKTVGNSLQPHYMHDPASQQSLLVNPEGEAPVAIPMPTTLADVAATADTLVQQVLNMSPEQKAAFMPELRARNRTVHAMVVAKLREIEGLAGPEAPAPAPTPPPMPLEPLNAAQFTADLAAAGVKVPAPEIVWTKESAIEYALHDNTTDDQYKAFMAQLQVENPAVFAAVAAELNTPEPPPASAAPQTGTQTAAKPEAKPASRSRKGNKDNKEGTK
jgi:hypothetical protein